MYGRYRYPYLGPRGWRGRYSGSSPLYALVDMLVLLNLRDLVSICSNSAGAFFYCRFLFAPVRTDPLKIVKTGGRGSAVIDVFFIFLPDWESVELGWYVLVCIICRGGRRNGYAM